MFTKRFWSAFMTDLIETESIRSGSFEFRLTILYPNTVAISRRPQFSDHLLTRRQHRHKIHTTNTTDILKVITCVAQTLQFMMVFYTEISLFCYKNIKKGSSTTWIKLDNFLKMRNVGNSYPFIFYLNIAFFRGIIVTLFMTKNLY